MNDSRRHVVLNWPKRFENRHQAQWKVRCGHEIIDLYGGILFI